MGKGKPRAAKSRDFQPCRRCQTPIHRPLYEQSVGLCMPSTYRLCGPCATKEWQEHQQYVQQNAVIVAELNIGFTEDLFSSQLVIEADGGYFQTVHWHDPYTHQAMADEHLNIFSSEEWQHLLLEATMLYPAYAHPESIMDDVEQYSINIRIGKELKGMQQQAQWQCPDGNIRFRLLWNKIHQQSPWFSRLALSI